MLRQPGRCRPHPRGRFDDRVPPGRGRLRVPRAPPARQRRLGRGLRRGGPGTAPRGGAEGNPAGGTPAGRRAARDSSWRREITGRLEHPGIVPVYGLGTYGDGRPFYAMRFIQRGQPQGGNRAVPCFAAGGRASHCASTLGPFRQIGASLPPRFDSLEFRQLLGAVCGRVPGDCLRAQPRACCTGT